MSEEELLQETKEYYATLRNQKDHIRNNAKKVSDE